MQRLLALAIATVALVGVLAVAGTCAKGGGSTRGGTDPSVVARNLVQAVIDGDDDAFMRYVNTGGTRAAPDTTALSFRVLRGCKIADVRTPTDPTREPVSVIFKDPCGSGTRAIPCLGVLLESFNGRWYYASMGGCSTREPI